MLTNDEHFMVSLAVK